MKKTLSLIVGLLMAVTVWAQQFEWVESYNGSDLGHNSPCNQIVSTAVDSQGNLYLLGTFTNGAHIGNHLLLPIAPYGPATNNINVVIAKLSPQGDVLWSKAIHGNDGNLASAYAMHLVGDTSLVCMVSFSLICSSGCYVYFLDTMIRNNNDLIENFALDDATVTGMITLDTAGALKEKHFLQIAMADSTGHILSHGDRANYEPYMDHALTFALSGELFDVDKEGNIYLCRIAQDIFDYRDGRSVSVNDGGVASLVVYVDGQPRHTIYPNGRYNSWNQMIMKFSPSFDSLYWSHYLFAADSSYSERLMGTAVSSLTVDDNDNYYVTIKTPTSMDNVDVMVQNGYGLHYKVRTAESPSSCLIAFNSDHEALYIKQLTCNDDTSGFPKSTHFFSISIDETCGNLFLLGVVAKDPLFGPNSNAHFLLGDDTVDLRNNACWFRLDKTDGHLLSYGKARSDIKSDLYGFGGNGSGYMTLVNFVARNNRVISQVRYQHDISFLDTSITLSSTSYGMGLMVWDYDGHEIDYIDYGADASSNLCGPILLKDSILYLSGGIRVHAHFGDLELPSTGGSRPFIAKYVDTAFMSPYAYQDPRREQRIEWEQDLSFDINRQNWALLTAQASSGLPVSYACEDTSVARVAGDTLILLGEGTTTVTAFQEGDTYGFLPAEPVSKTLTTYHVGIGHKEHPQCRLYPNPASGAATLSFSGVAGKVAVEVVDMSGRKVFRENIDADEKPVRRLDLSGLAGGAYFVRIYNADFSTVQKLVVKNM